MTEPKTSFDRVAVEYEKHRVGYDQRVVSEIIRGANLKSDSRVLEIGAGTGQASLQFATTGMELVCVEPGFAMANILREKLKEYPNASCICTSFETLSLPPGTFDCIFAAQSLHWIDPSTRYTRPHSLLKPGGLFAAFWKRTDPEFWLSNPRLSDILSNYLNDFRVQSLSEYEIDASQWLGEIIESKLFRFCELKRFQSLPTPFSESRFIGTIMTSSSAIMLPDACKAAFKEELISYFDKHPTDGVERRFETTLVLGYRTT